MCANVPISATLCNCGQVGITLGSIVVIIIMTYHTWGKNCKTNVHELYTVFNNYLIASYVFVGLSFVAGVIIPLICSCICCFSDPGV